MFFLSILLAVSLLLDEVSVTGHRAEVESDNMRLVMTLNAEDVPL